MSETIAELKQNKHYAQIVRAALRWLHLTGEVVVKGGVVRVPAKLWSDSKKPQTQKVWKLLGASGSVLNCVDGCQARLGAQHAEPVFRESRKDERQTRDQVSSLFR